jgi:hypothetical protein
MIGALKNLCTLFFVLLLLSHAQVWAAGDVVYLSGTVIGNLPGQSPRLLEINSKIREGETVSTAEGSFARIRFIDNSEMALRPNTAIQVNAIRYKAAEPREDNFAVSLIKGGLRSVTGLIGKRNKEKVKVNTPLASLGIRGTHFGLQLCEGNGCDAFTTASGKPLRNGLYADVAEGIVYLENAKGTLDLAKDEFGYVADAQTAPEKLAPEDGYRVQLPYSVLFESSTQLWSEGSQCSACVMQ